jgi:hypothetical protein
MFGADAAFCGREEGFAVGLEGAGKEGRGGADEVFVHGKAAGEGGDFEADDFGAGYKGWARVWDRGGLYVGHGGDGGGLKM